MINEIYTRTVERNDIVTPVEILINISVGKLALKLALVAYLLTYLFSQYWALIKQSKQYQIKRYRFS